MAGLTPAIQITKEQYDHAIALYNSGGKDGRINFYTVNLIEQCGGRR